jgi:diguanylate cyclase (GGDEF)-like protein
LPLLSWLLAAVAGTHALGALADLLPGGGGPGAAAADAAVTVAVLTWAYLGRRKVAAESVQIAAVVLIIAAALASGGRAAGASQAWFGVDAVIAVIAATALVDRVSMIVATAGSIVVWGSALVAGALVAPVTSRPTASEWVLLAGLPVFAAMVALALRLALSSLRRAHRAAAHELAQRATSDPVTGAGNRRGLEQLALPMIEHARRQGEAVHCLFLDLDEFRLVNEQLGRDQGDVVLIAVCEALLASVRATDVLARWGDDQFVVIGPGTGTSPLEMERRVRSQLTAEPPVPVQVWPGKVSIGSATLVPWDDGNLDSLLHRAEEDMRLRRSLRRQSRDRERSAAVPPREERRDRRANPPTTPPTVPNDL